MIPKNSQKLLENFFFCFNKYRYFTDNLRLIILKKIFFYLDPDPD
jgi:hypothetical protein